MTPIYIAEFKRELKCKQCNARRTKRRKFCLYHLGYAKQKFAEWCSARRAKCKCIRCNRKSFNNELRCRTHKKLNRTQCSAWSAAKRAQARATGFCGLPRHASEPVIPGTAWCQKCRDERLPRQRAWRAARKAANDQSARPSA